MESMHMQALLGLVASSLFLSAAPPQSALIPRVRSAAIAPRESVQGLGVHPPYAAFDAVESRLVFLADPERDFEATLFATKPEGGARVTLSDPSNAPDGVSRFRIVPDGRTVVFIASDALWRVPIDGGQATEVAQAVDGDSIAFTPDGKRIAFLRSSPGGVELCVAASSNGTSSVINARPVRRFRLTSDGERVVFAERDLPQSSVGEVLYAHRFDTGSTLALTGTLLRGAFQLSPRGERVLYLGPGAQRPSELLSTRIEPLGATVSLSSSLSPLSSVRDWRVTPDGAHAVFFEATRSRLLSAPVDGSALPRDLHPAGAVHSFEFMGGRVVYLTLAFAPALPTLHSVLAFGGRSVQLGRDVVRVLGNDSRRVYFSALEAGAERLFAAPVDGSAPALALASLSPGAFFPSATTLRETFLVDEPRGRVVYRVETGTRSALFSVPLDGSAPALELALDVGTILLSRTRGEVYFAGLPPAFTMGLYRAPLDGSSPPKLVTGL
jgi:hypothetical protein